MKANKNTSYCIKQKRKQGRNHHAKSEEKVKASKTEYRNTQTKHEISKKESKQKSKKKASRKSSSFATIMK